MWKIDRICSTRTMTIADCAIATAWIFLEETGVVIEVFGKAHNLVDTVDVGYEAFHTRGKITAQSKFIGSSCLKNGRLILDFEGAQIRLCRFEDIIVVNVLNEQRESIKSLTVKLDDLIPKVA